VKINLNAEAEKSRRIDKQLSNLQEYREGLFDLAVTLAKVRRGDLDVDIKVKEE
jgi:hypothetical protein